MSKISIIAVGKLPSEYAQILKHFMQMLGNSIELHEIVTKKNINGPEIKEHEAEAISAKFTPSDYVILLDPVGHKFDSYEFAEYFRKTHDNNGKICFIIGGAWGVSDKIKTRANKTLSLSDLTFPHMLARIILIEQIYRAKSIINNHPYHK